MNIQRVRISGRPDRPGIWRCRITLWSGDLIEPTVSGRGVAHGYDGAVAEHRSQERPIAGGQIRPVKDPVVNARLAGEREDRIAAGSASP